jgi:hypothetical protein
MQKSEANTFKDFFLVFFIALIPRIFLNFFYYAKFGLYSVKGVETWFFTGLVSGEHLDYLTHGAYDPTYWILSPVAHAISEQYHLFAVEWIGVLLSCLAAAIMFLLGKKLYGRNVGFAAAVIFATMVQPLAMNVTSFTHDIVQMPLILSCLLFCAYAIKGGWILGALLGASYYLVWSSAKNINDSINAAVIVSALMAGYVIYSWAFEKAGLSLRIYSFFNGFTKKTGKILKKIDIGYCTYILGVLFFLVALHSTILFSALEGMLSALPQGRLGSADVTPTTVETYFIRYNLLMLLLPALVFYSLRRRDIAGISLAFVGFLFSTQMDRGTRILDLGMALMAANAIVSVGDVKKPLKGLLLRVCVVFFAVSTAYFVFFSHASWFIILSSAFGGILFLRSALKRDYVGCLAVVVSLAILINLNYFMGLESRKVITEAEYHTLSWLRNNNLGGKVLAAWDKGYLVSAVAKLEPVSSPGWIRWDIHSMLWMPKQQAARNLRQAGVRYVMFNDENFNMVEIRGERAYRLMGGLLTPEGYIPSTEYASMYTIYNLRHSFAESDFRLLKNTSDEKTGTYTLLYEVLGEDDTDGKRYVGGIFYGEGKDYRLLLRDKKSVNGSVVISYLDVGNMTIDRGEVVEISYPVDRGDFSECIIRVERASGYGGFIWGTLAIRDSYPGSRNITVGLFDIGRGRDVGSITIETSQEEGFFEYRFDGVESFTDYSLSFEPNDGLYVSSRNSQGPFFGGVSVLEAFC